jgi:hypothetical protein
VFFLSEKECVATLEVHYDCDDSFVKLKLPERSIEGSLSDEDFDKSLGAFIEQLELKNVTVQDLREAFAMLNPY